MKNIIILIWIVVVSEGAEITISGSSSVGSVQTLMFGNLVAAADGEECEKLLTEVSHLGTGAVCSLPTKVNMVIKYGYGVPPDTPQTITLRTEGFNGGPVVGSFDRPSLPTFAITSDQTVAYYQDYTATITLGEIVTNNQPSLVYTWTYLKSPDGEKPDISSAVSTFYFEYWEMSPGEYQIGINLTDPNNEQFYYQKSSSIFEVKESCFTNCNVITWKLSTDPGTCSLNCVEGNVASDTFVFGNSGSAGEFLITATHDVGNTGGTNLSIRSILYDGKNSVPCGADIKFPSVFLVNGDTMPDCYSSNSEVVLSTHILSNGNMQGTDYLKSWVQPSTNGFDECVEGASKCTIPAGSLPKSAGSGYQFQLLLKLVCLGGNVWSTLSFKTFDFSPSITVATLGSVQTLTFSTSMSPATPGEESCVHLIAPDSKVHLGEGAICSLATSTTLLIKYGRYTTMGEQKINLLTSGFSECAQGEFERPNFLIAMGSGNTPRYQDTVASLTMYSLGNAGVKEMRYSWVYTEFPTGASKPNIIGETSTSCDFLYRQMSPGNYQVRVKTTDPSNAAFYQETDTPIFTVLQSCYSQCHVITWLFTSDPGTCLDGCTSGTKTGDNLVYLTTLMDVGKYSVTATYSPGSIGGSTLNIIPSKFNGLSSVACGGNLKYPRIALLDDSPGVQSSASPLTISATLLDQGLTLGTHFTETWVQPPTFSACQEGKLSCTIPVGGLTDGDKYIFKLQLKMACHLGAIVWSEVVFTQFTYSPTLTAATRGSIQTITFSNPVGLAELGKDDCPDLLTSDSMLYLGIICECAFNDVFNAPNSLIIKYGYGVSADEEMIALRAQGFKPNIYATFSRPELPRFTLESKGVIEAAYQDNIVTLSAGQLKNVGGANLQFEWTYLQSPNGATKPDLSGISGSSFAFKYYEMSPGSYKIRVRLRDPANTPYYYQEDSPTMTVLSSCSASCDVVTWTMQSDPGSCIGDCVSGFTPGDSFYFATAGSASPYTITATYKVGSIGGADLSIIPGKYEGLSSVECGGNLRFPRILRNEAENSQEIQSPSSALALSGIVTENGLTFTTDYTIKWIQPETFTSCLDSSPSCTVPSSDFSEGGGPYQFFVQLRIVCKSEFSWSSAAFTPFYTTAAFTSTTEGSVQTITFASSLAASGSDGCSDLFTAGSLSYLGADNTYSCSLSANRLSIKYGSGTVAGAQTITLLSTGFTPSTNGVFARPTLPKFTLKGRNVVISAYQDNIGVFSAEEIIYMGNPNIQYVWTYEESPRSSIKPSLPATSSTSFTLNYWELSPGKYSISLRMNDMSNLPFFYAETSAPFTVQESCFTNNCNVVSWMMTGNPGLCSSGCVTGHPNSDTFTFETAGTGPYFISATYKRGSVGGVNLQIVSSKYNGLLSVPCGENIKFPSTSVEDITSSQSSGNDINLSYTLTKNGLIATTDYTEEWIRPTGTTACTDGNNKCKIGAGGLVVGKTYTFGVRVSLVCYGGTWEETSFRPFSYVKVITDVPPIAKITGGDESYRTTGDIILSGITSVNPGEPDTHPAKDLTYLWECFTDIERTTKQCITGTGNVISDSPTMNLSIAGETLPEGIYYYKLTVEHSITGLQGSRDTMLTLITEEGGPLIKIVPVNTGLMEGDILNPNRSVSFYIEYLEEEVETLGAVYEWVIVPSITECVETGRYFTIVKNTMKEDIEYLLKCKVTLADKTTTTTITRTIHPAQTITSGELTTDKKEGIGLDTEFNLNAEGFSGGSGQILEYKFTAQVMGTSTQLALANSGFSSSSSIFTTLPPGAQGQLYIVKVTVIAQNTLGVRATSNINITVSPKSDGYTTEYINDLIGSSKTVKERVINLNLVAPLPDEGSSDTDKITIKKAIVDSINTLLDDTSLSSTEVVSLVSAASGVSERGSKAEMSTNKVSEDIEDKLILRVKKGELEVGSVVDGLLRLISNDMEGIKVEVSNRGVNDTSELKELEERQISRVENIQELYAELLKKEAVGTIVDSIIENNFALRGIVNTAKNLGSLSFSLGTGRPVVNLSSSVSGSGTQSQDTIMAAIYLDLKLDPHPSNPQSPLSNTVIFTLSDYATGESINRENMSNPITFIFPILSQTVDPPKCVYYDPLTANYSLQGMVTTNQSTATSLICTSVHFSEFTVVPVVVALEEDGDDDDGANVGAIAGGTVAAFLVIVIIVVLGVIWYIYKQVSIFMYLYIYIYIIYIIYIQYIETQTKTSRG